MPNIIPANSTYTIPDRDRWVPKVRAGHFFIGDRRYYLYASKKTVRLEQCRRMRFPLAGAPVGDVVCRLEGVPYTNFEIQGTDAVLNLEDIESHISYWAQFVWDARKWGYFDAGFILTDDSVVDFDYQTLVWNTSTHGFDTIAINQHTTFRDGVESYQLPDTPIPGTPIVITDDSKLATDGRSYAIEFDVDGEGNIDLNAVRNYVLNPNMEVTPSGGSPNYPSDWLLGDTTGAIRRYPGTGYVGAWTCWFDGATTGKVRQEVDIDADTPLSLIAKVRMAGTGTAGIGYLEMAFKGTGGNIYGTGGSIIGADPDPAPFSLRDQISVTTADWAELSLVAGPNDTFEPTDGVIPSDITEVEVRFHGTGTGPMEFDAIQLARTKYVPQYGYISPDATVEYETDPTGIYRPDPHGLSWPFAELNHIDLNAASEESHAGFLMLEEFSDSHDEDLDIGGIDTTDPTGVPRGILPKSGSYWRFGRRNLPYARMDGRTKLVRRYPLRLENREIFEPVSSYQSPREPAACLMALPENTRRDASRKIYTTVTSGESIVVSAIFTDGHGNAVPQERVLIWNTGDGSVSAAEDFTNDAGRVMVTFTAGSTTGAGVDELAFRHQLSGLTRSVNIDVV